MSFNRVTNRVFEDGVRLVARSGIHSRTRSQAGGRGHIGRSHVNLASIYRCKWLETRGMFAGTPCAKQRHRMTPNANSGDANCAGGQMEFLDSRSLVHSFCGGKPSWVLTVDDAIRWRRARARRDFFLFAAFALTFGILCFLFDLNDRFHDFLRRHTGNLKLDEFMLIGAVASFGLALFSIRRWFDVRAELAERKQIEEALRQRTGFVQLQQILAAAINEARNIDEALQGALDLVCAYTGWPAGRVLLRDADNGHFAATQVWHVPDSPQYAPIRMSTEADLANCEAHLHTRIDNNGDSFWITDLVGGSGCPRAKIASELGLKASFTFPVWAGKEVVAILEFFSPTLEPPDKNLQQVLHYTGTSLGRAIERDRAEEALRRSEDTFRSIIDNSSDIIAILNSDGTYRYCSPSIQHILGYDPRELIGQNAFDFVHPEDVMGVRQAFLENLKESGRSDHAEFRYRHRDGSWRLVDRIARNLLGDPAIAGIVVNSRDITERRRAMEQLRESERRYQVLFNQMVAAFTVCEMICDEQGNPVDWRCLEVNAAFEGVVGLRREQVIGQTVREVFPDIESDWIETFGHVSRTGESVHFERWFKPLGKALEVSVFCPQPGQVAVTFRDISGRKEADDALRQSEERYRRLLDSTTDYIYTVQVEEGRATATTHGTGCIAVTGYSAEDYAADPYLWVQMVHVTDRDAVKQQAESAMCGKQPSPLEHRILHKDGSIRWIRNTIVLRKDEHGVVVSYDGLVSDITERKRAEIAMRNLVAGTAGVTGNDFFLVLARHLGAALGVRYVFVSDLVQRGPNRLRPLAFVADGKLESHDEYETTDAPCGRALETGELCFVPDLVAEQFPKDLELAAIGARSYMGVPLRSSGDELIGLLCVVHDEPLSDPDRARDILNIFAARAAAELERQHAERTLRKTNETLQALIRSAPLGIVAVDADSRVIIWNPAAEKMFGWTEDEVLGKPYPAVARDKWAAHIDVRDRTMRGEAVTGVEVQRVTRSGAIIDVALSIAPLRDAYGKAYATVGLMADITERKRVAERLRLHGSALEAAANGIMITDRAGIILWVNTAFTTLAGYAIEEVVGRTPSVLKSGIQGPQFYDELRSTITAGRVWHGEIVNRRKDGTLYTEEMTITPVRDSAGEISHYIAIKQDVTKRKQAQAALEELQRQQRALLDNIPDIAWLKDRDGKFIAVNHALGKACGVNPDELVGKTDFDVWDKELAERYVADDHEVMLSRLSKRVEEPLTDTQGREFWVETIRTPIFNDLGDVIGTTGIARDVTDRKHGEETLRETNRRLHEALSGLKAAEQQVIQQERLRALGTMASGIAHDFNNALAAILGFTELLLYRPEVLRNHEQSLKYVQMMNTAAKDAGNTVSRLREFYRYREKNDVFAPIRVSQLVEQVVSLTQPKWKNQAEATGISIQVRTELGELPAILGNDADLREALINLVFNAVDAMPDGGTLTIRTRTENDHAVIEVADTGTGMAEDVRQRCLEPFFSTKGESGTGLGLSMVYGIVKRHEGDVEIDTALGRGTTFRIRLPLRCEHVSASGTIAASQEPARPLRILLVDDEPQVCLVMQEFLRGDGHTVETACDGREGFEKFQAGKYDLAVLDRAMPGMNGDQLAAAIKNLAPEVTVILLTGFGAMMAAAGEKPAGVDYIVSKPVTINELRAAIAQAYRGVLNNPPETA